jgi:NTP pyrophosphatase (non-canonical NTP hydrolase)
MNRTEHLLTILSEECAEVSQRVSKALRFGLSEIQPGQELDNAQRVTQEMQDLMGTFEMLTKELSLPEMDEYACIEKQEKIEKFLELSKKQGTLII